VRIYFGDAGLKKYMEYRAVRKELASLGHPTMKLEVP
jgi:hypothetical protein